jgi:imidazolonepropionase-like amidohydrolase
MWGNDLAAWKRQRQPLARTAEADAWAAGLGVTVPGGAPLQDLPPEVKLPTLTQAAQAAQARAFVDARVAEGSDYIKVFIEDLSEYGGTKRLPTLSKQEVRAVIAAAHADGKMAIVHAQAQDAAREAIVCGADGLAHMFPDRAADPAFLALAREHHVQAGLKPEQALAAATSLPAKFFNLGDRGTIQSGYRADLVLIDGDPTQSIDDTLSIARIWKNGYAVDRTAPKP